MSSTDRRIGSRTVSRPSAGRAAMIILFVWVAAVVFVLVVAADTRMGPVVLRLTKDHGVHLGDIYATLACAVVAVLITVWVVVDHTGRKRRWVRAQRRAAAAAEQRAALAEHAADEDHDGDYVEGHAYDTEHAYDTGHAYADAEYEDEHAHVEAPADGYDDHAEQDDHGRGAGHDEPGYADVDPPRPRHEADPDLVETVLIEHPPGVRGRHRHRQQR